MVRNIKNKKKFVIGVDGGGTKTAVAVADMDGKIIAQVLAGSSNVRNLGIKPALKNVADGIYGVIKGKRNITIVSTFIGLPAMEEEYKDKKPAIIRELKKYKKIEKIFKGKILIGSDQLVAFRAGANGKDGIVAICGTGTATHGWNNGREALANNRGWLASKGSAIYIGEKVVQAIIEDLEGRDSETLLSRLIFKNFNFKDSNDLLEFIYKDSTASLPKFSLLCDQAAIKGDKVAQEILIQSGKEIARSVRAVAAKLVFFEQVPLVLAGGVYKSRWVADTAMNEIERYYPGKFDFVVVADPVIGAIRLAMENAGFKI